MNDAFFEYAGSELAVIEITAGLRQLDEEKGFSASFVDNYGYPVWNESKIIPMDWEWGFDYFTQKMYPETSSSKLLERILQYA